MDKLERKAKQKELKLNTKQLEELHYMIKNCDFNDLVVRSMAEEYISVHPRNRKTRKIYRKKFKEFNFTLRGFKSNLFLSFSWFFKKVKVNRLPAKYGKRKRRSSKFFSGHFKHKHFRLRRQR